MAVDGGERSREMTHGASEVSEGRMHVGLGALAAVAAISTAAIAIRLAGDLPAIWIAAGRVSITALVAAPFFLRQMSELFVVFRARPAVLFRCLAAGAFLALHFGTWIASLSMTSVVTSVALVSTQPLFAAGMGRVLGDRVSLNAYAGAVIAIVGGYVMSGAQVGTGMGAALALAGAFFAAAYLAVGRSLRDGVPLGGYFVVVHLFAATMLITVGWGTSQPVDLAWESAWPYVVYLGLVPGVIGHGLLNWAVRRIELHRVSMLILLEPIGAGVLAWWWLAESPAPAEVMGGAVILVGVAVGARQRAAGRIGTGSTSAS